MPLCGGNSTGAFECSLSLCVKTWNNSRSNMPTGCDAYLKTIENGLWTQPAAITMDVIGLLALILALTSLVLLRKLFGTWLYTMLKQNALVQARMKELFLEDHGEQLWKSVTSDAVAFRNSPRLEDLHPVKLCYPGTTFIGQQVSRDWLQEMTTKLFLPILHPGAKTEMFAPQEFVGNAV
eukprot:TRINITY_DN5316_c0_g1_i1.p1 TRINITY_DN5316_c0_g1~~TRINITY_DN5316_c0_g1_i1.p1  ORF type:complete len:180 (+),score=26.72 TRINITY_DN5316_c0_g1_i1:81-620(+)